MIQKADGVSLIAIMLGRLEMSLDQCLETFRTYTDEVFGHPQPLYRALGSRFLHKYSDERLIRATQTVVGIFGPCPDDPEKRSLFAAPGGKCKTYDAHIFLGCTH